MFNVDEVVKRLGAISRQRQVVKTSLLDEPTKARLCAELDEQTALLQAQLSPPPAGGKKP